MKKSILFLLLCFMAINVSAQQHLEFLGKSLNGNLTQFTKQMEAVGLTRNYEASKPFDDARVFDGEYAGYLADFYVYYHPTTKLVYRAKAVIPFGTEETAASVAQDIIDELLESYRGKYDDDPDEDGNPNLRFYVFANGNNNKPLGIIDVYMDCDDDEEEYDIHVDYIDIANAEKAGYNP